MTDRELLEAAAKAAGMLGAINWTPGATPWLRVDPDHTRPWNPLTDDGDALRLAVKLGIALDRASNRCWTFAAGMLINGVCEEFYGDDPYAATRRAIVRAAAALVKA